MSPRPLREIIDRLRFGAAGMPAEDPAAESEQSLQPEQSLRPMQEAEPEAAVEQQEASGSELLLQQPAVGSGSQAPAETELITVTPPVFEELSLGGYEEWRPGPADRPAKHRQEKKMSDRLSCSAGGITEVVVDDLSEDAKIRSSEGLEEIVVDVKRDGPDLPSLAIEGDKVFVRDGFAKGIEVPPGVSVTAGEALGDLKVPRLGGNLRLRSVMGDLRIEDVTGVVEIEHIYGDVRAEHVAEMHVVDCDADFRFSGGDLQVESVSGDMRVTDAGNVQGLRVHGDLWLERLSGGVKFEVSHGDVRLNDIEGAAGLATVAGDFRATNVRGALNVGQVHGDTQLEGPFPAAEGYAVSTSGDAHIRLMAEDDVRLTVRALGRVRSNLPLTPSTDGSTTYTATVGEGKVRVVLTANGDLRIEAAAGGREDVRGPGGRKWGPGGSQPGEDPFAELSGLGERIRQQVTASLAAAGINADTGEVNFSVGRGRGRQRPPEPPRPSRPPQPPHPTSPGSQPSGGGPLTTEQLAVLKMLEEGRISAEEADSLLKALGA